MHDYDIALKSVIRRLAGDALRELAGFAIARWHNIEFPEVKTLRADLLGETADGTLVQVELQSTNDPDMPLRMAEYALAIYRQFGKFPRQVVLYVGKAPLSMPDRLEWHSLSFRYRVVDIRDMDAAPLLASANVDENVIAVLMQLSDERGAVHGILQRISECAPGERERSLKELGILAGLRGLGEIIKQETKTMPILDDIMDHDLLGPILRQGLEQGRVEGRIEGEQTVVMRQIERRFGSIPAWARQRIGTMSIGEIEETALRLLEARSLEDLLQK